MTTPLPVQNQRESAGWSWWSFFCSLKREFELSSSLFFVATVTTVPTPLILVTNGGGHGWKLFDHPKKIAESAFHVKIRF